MTPRLSGHVYHEMWFGCLCAQVSPGICETMGSSKTCIFVPKAFNISNVDYCFTRSPNIFYDKTGVTNQCLRCINRTDLAVSLQVKKNHYYAL